MKFLHAIFVFLLFMSAVMAADELIVNGTAVSGGKIPLKGFVYIYLLTYWLPTYVYFFV